MRVVAVLLPHRDTQFLAAFVDQTCGDKSLIPDRHLRKRPGRSVHALELNSTVEPDFHHRLRRN